jgi:glutamyl-tRNA reductase
VTRLLVNRLLHAPSAALRGLAVDGGSELVAIERLLARLFDLPDATRNDTEKNR